ncbi:MAG: hypothetical protein ABJA71_09205 [Ginsengibacter sp.]
MLNGILVNRTLIPALTTLNEASSGRNNIIHDRLYCGHHEGGGRPVIYTAGFKVVDCNRDYCIVHSLFWTFSEYPYFSFRHRKHIICTCFYWDTQLGYV